MKKVSSAPFSIMLAGMLWAGNLLTVDVQAASQMMDYYMPTPITGSLSLTCWGAAQVGPRDQSNGLEDKTLAKYVYWDGGILKGPDSTYYMFAARWDQSLGHNGWMSGSKAVWATSKNLYGPYTDQGYCFTDNGSAGHNVNVIKLKSGDPCGYVYGMTLSGAVAGSGRAYGANSLSGPWKYIGNFTLDMNGYSGMFSPNDNFRTFLGPDNKYHCLCDRIGIADNFMGPYKCQQSNGFCNSVSGSPTTNMEDPYQFYSGGKYHVLMNCWSAATAYSYTSTDGIHFTMDKGFAYQPSANNVHYTDSTVNHWKLLERPFAYIENGHVVAFTFAAINCEKADDKPNDQNGSKVIVVPFDGASFDDTLGAIFYPSNDYAGTAVTLKPGNYTKAQLSTAGISDNSASSIKMSSGLSVEIYNGDNFTGTKWVIKSDCANLSTIGCNDSMSSVKIVKLQDTTTYTVRKSTYTVNNTIMIPGLGTFKVGNRSEISVVQFTNLLGKKVLEMPVKSGAVFGKCNLSYGSYIMNFYGKERVRSSAYKVLIK